jgi:hypothetical protein
LDQEESWIIGPGSLALQEGAKTRRSFASALSVVSIEGGATLGTMELPALLVHLLTDVTKVGNCRVIPSNSDVIPVAQGLEKLRFA